MLQSAARGAGVDYPRAGRWLSGRRLRNFAFNTLNIRMRRRVHLTEAHNENAAVLHRNCALNSWIERLATNQKVVVRISQGAPFYKGSSDISRWDPFLCYQYATAGKFDIEVAQGRNNQ